MNEDTDRRHRPSDADAAQADRWLARLRSPACSADDRHRFRQWLAEHPAHWQAYNRSERIWAAAGQVQDPEPIALADQVLARTDRRGLAPWHRRGVLGWLAAAAAVAAVTVGLIGSGWLERGPAAVTYATAIGEIRSFTLPDDSVVTLDTDTVLQVRMGRQARDIALQRGQARFEVARDAQRPFSVDTPVARITALGTVFQVRNVGPSTEVDLIEGRVRVAPASAELGRVRPQLLSPGERLVARADAPWSRAPTDAATVDGWLSGRLVFEAMPLRDAVEAFNRYSQRKLRIDDPGIESIPIDGVFDAGDTESITLALEYAYSLHVEERGGEVVLRGPRDAGAPERKR